MDDRFCLPKTSFTSRDDLAVRNAVEIANYQVRKRKEAIHAMEVDKVVRRTAKEYKKDVIADFTDWTYGCMALVMHRMYGWGSKRIAKLFEALEVQRAELIDSGMHSNEIWDIVREEIGLSITTVDGFDWDKEE